MRLPEIRTVPVADIEIPAELSRLYDIAYNLWWTWSPRAHQIFSTIDPARWLRYRNPVEVLINVEPNRWEPLVLDETFLAAYGAVVEAFDRYLEGAASAWFPTTYPDYDGGPVAYFSTEFGWHESLGIYSGGLGVLSGDHCKSASDLGIPFVGIGLIYRNGYFRQTVDPDGNQQHFYPDHDLRRLPILPVTGPGGREVRVRVELPGREVALRVCKATVGRVPVLLLDSDVRENDPADRPITSTLYVRGREMRLCQEVVLGIGGVRALRALGIAPAVWHLNEGHSAFAAFERLAECMRKEKLGFDDALERISKAGAFTTHTPVPAGNEIFDQQLVRRYFEPIAAKAGVDLERFLALGRARKDEDSGTFNLTALALRSSERSNAVSRLHGKVARSMWESLEPPRPDGRPRIGHVTNGVHVPTWMGPEVADLLTRRLGTGFCERLLEPGFADSVLGLDDEEVWSAHQAQKDRLVMQTRTRIRTQLARHGRSPDELRDVEHLLDPDALTLGFARRFATYKRADLLFRDRERLRAILCDRDRPVQVLFAGKAHPADRPGQDIVRRIFLASVSAEFRGRIVFLEDYDMRVARSLVQGVDVWVNTPRRPNEASGTSGMKASVNGALHLSVLDGWWAEGYDPSHGWPIGDGEERGDPSDQDRVDAESIYRVLADEIVPCFYDRNASGLPVRWIARMKRAIAMLSPRFSTDRMLREYVQRAYLPAFRGEAGEAGVDEALLWSP